MAQTAREVLVPARIHEDTTMRRAILRARKQPIAWGDVEFAERLDQSADALDERIGDLAGEPEDQRVAVELLLRRMIDGVG